MAPNPILILCVTNFDDNESHPCRTLTLRSPDYACDIGRGSRSGVEAYFPSDTNGYFESKVMSRKHARFTADPTTREVFIYDLDSMHGTKLNGRPLTPDSPQHLRMRDRVQLGADVVRNEDTFLALEIGVVTLQWFEDESAVTGDLSMPPPMVPSRTFAVPEYSEDEHDFASDSELEYLGECAAPWPITDEDLHQLETRSSSVAESVSSHQESIAYEEVDRGSNTSSSSPEVAIEAEKQHEPEQNGVSKCSVTLPLTAHLVPKTSQAGSAAPPLQEAAVDEDHLTESERDFEDWEEEAEDPNFEVSSMDGQIQPSNSIPLSHPSQGAASAAHAIPNPATAAMLKTAVQSSHDVFNYPTLPNWSVYKSSDQDPDPSSLDTFATDLPFARQPSYLQFPAYGYDSITPAEQVMTHPQSTLISNATLAAPPALGQIGGQDTSLAPRSQSSELLQTRTPNSTALQGRHTKIPASKASEVADELRRCFPHVKRSPLKRKANLISEDIISDDQLRPETGSQHRIELIVDSQKFSTDDSIRHAAITPNEASVEPPTKRLRRPIRVRMTTHGQSRGDTIKYVATALAGIAVGAIGTIWGLVALPEDFFG